LSECFHIRGPKLINNGPHVDSDDFSSSDDQQVSSTVGVAPSAGELTNALDLLSGANAPGCLTAALNTALADRLNSDSADQLPDGTKFGTISVNPESFEALGDRTVALRASIPFSVTDVDGTVYIDFIVVQKGRAGVILSAQDVLSPFSTDLSASLLRKVLARLPEGGGTS
jgi:hypothetical protein